MKEPTGQTVGQAEDEFNYQRDKIRKNDITSEYIALVEQLLQDFLLIMRAERDRMLTEIREAKLEALAAKLAERDAHDEPTFRIYGFRSFIKNPKSDYFLGELSIAWAEDGTIAGAELFLALDLIARIKSFGSNAMADDKREAMRNALLHKYLLHELICPIFGHDSATKAIDRHFADGNLQQVVKAVLSEKESPWDTQSARLRRLSFESYRLEVKPGGATAEQALPNNDIRSLLAQNWFYHLTKKQRESGELVIDGKQAIMSRISQVKQELPVLYGALGLVDNDGRAKTPFRLYMSGSWFWCGEFIDDIEGNIEVDVVYDGDYTLDRSTYLDNKDVKTIFGIESLAKERARVRVNYMGTHQLERAAQGSVHGRDELRRKLLLLTHESVQFAGKPIELRPWHSKGMHEMHLRNVGALADAYRQELEHGTTKNRPAAFLQARVNAIDVYVSKAAKKLLEDREPIRRHALRKKDRPGIFSLAGRIVVNILRAFLTFFQNDRSSGVAVAVPFEEEQEAPTQEVEVKLSLEQLPPMEPGLDEPEKHVLRLGDAKPTEPAPPVENLPTTQSMISFYGVPVSTGDILYGCSGRYRLKTKLGEGAQGGVWVVDEVDEKGRPVREIALKIPGRHHEWDWNKEAEWRALAGFNKEINALSKLVWHPNIIRIQDWYEQNSDVPFYVMEAVSGTDLHDYFANRDFDECHIVSIFTKLAGALAAAHSEGLAHRDLKPENIMIRDEDGEPVILDFGTASDIEYSESLELTAVGAAKGTPIYMSPEMAARLVSDKAGFLVVEKDSAFGHNGCTRRYRQDDIIERIDKAEAAHENAVEKLRVRRMSIAKRIRLWIAMKRVRPILDRMKAAGQIYPNPVIRRARVIDAGEITFGAYVHNETFYVERPFLKDRSMEFILIGNHTQEYKQDIYTLGVMLYQRLTNPKNGGESKLIGRLPFPIPEDRSDLWGAAMARMYEKYIPIGEWHQKAPDSYHELSPSLQAVVMRMLSLDPRDRYSAKELERELQQFLRFGQQGDEAERSEEYRRLLGHARTKKAYRWMAAGVIGSFISLFVSSAWLTNIGDKLVPSGGQPETMQIFIRLLSASIIALLGAILVLAICALLLGLFLVWRHRFARAWRLHQHLQERKQA